MSKKGGKKGKDVEVVVDKEKLFEVDRTFYELDIEDAKKKILRLRSHIQNLIASNAAAVEEVRALKEDRSDEAGELTKKVDETFENIIHIKAENAILTEAYEKERQKTDDTIQDLEAKYRAMHDQMCSDIKRVNSKLTSLEEFRLNQDKWMEKFSQRADEIETKEQESRELFRQMEAKSVYECETLKDELISKLTMAGEEFTGAGSSNASNINTRLIRENIALQKNIDLFVTSNIEMTERMKKEEELYKLNVNRLPKMKQHNKQLILESQEKLKLIENMSKTVRKLKEEYIESLSYREQNMSVSEFQMCARFRRKKLKSFVLKISQQMNSIERELNLYDYLIDQYKSESAKIGEHLENVRATIERSIRVADQEIPNAKASKDIFEKIWRERNDLLGTLVEILKIDFDPLKPSQRVSIATIEPYEKVTHFEEIFKEEAPSYSSLMDICATYIDTEYEVPTSKTRSDLTLALETTIDPDQLEYATIVPEQRPGGRAYIFDVESGTSLYYSSALEDPDRMQAEDQGGAAVEEEEEASSTESSSVQKLSTEDDKKQTSAEPTDRTTQAQTDATASNKLPPGTIVDVEFEEEFDEYYMSENERIEEDEEYNINLFY